MPDASPIQTSFNGGVFSPLLDGHIDAPRRGTAYKDSNNLIPLKQGPLVRRGATRNVFETLQTVVDDTKLAPFLFNDEQAYILEVSPLALRVYRDGGVVTKSADDVTITGISATSPAVVTVGALPAGYSNVNWIVITGLTEAVHLNNRWYRIDNKTATTVELFETDLVTPIDNTVGNGGVAETSSTGLMQNVFFLDIPYSASDLFDSGGLFRPDVVQSNDVMFIAHPDFVTRILARTDHDAWTITKMEYKNGPWLEENVADTAMFVTLVSGRTFSVVSSVANIVLPSDTLDAASGGDANDLGTATESNRLFKRNFDNDAVGGTANITDEWAWGQITKYVDTTTFEFTVSDDSKFFGANNINDEYWALGAYSETTGYPSVIEIHEGRLLLGASTTEPRVVHFSTINGFSPTDGDFTPYDANKNVRPDDGFRTAIGGGNAAPIQWIASTNRGLVVGTSNSEGVIRSSSRSETLAPGNASYKPGTTIGSRSIQPLNVNDNLLFVQNAGRRVHELAYSFDDDRLVAPDMTELAEHITREFVIAIAYQQEPINTVWCVLADGNLIAFTYERVANVLGWHPHKIAGTDAAVESIAVIPSEDLSRDELWMTVRRTINGAVKRYIERMDRWYEEDIDRDDIYQQDSGLSYSSTKTTISNVELLDPVRVTVTAHPYSNGDIVYLKDVVGTTEINRNKYKIAGSTANTFNLTYIGSGNDVDGTGFTAYVSGGTAQESVSIFRALDYLEGETLEVYVDGNKHGDLVVTKGAITLNNGDTGANVNAGYGSTWKFEAFPVDAGSATGTAQGKIKKLVRPQIRLKDTLGFRYGEEGGELVEESFLYGSMLDSNTPLFTGDLTMDWPLGHDKDGIVYCEGDGPFPVQIQALMPHVKTQDASPGR